MDRRNPDRRRRDPGKREDAEQGRKAVPKRRSALGKMVGKTVEWIERLDALEERRFGEQRREEAPSTGEHRRGEHRNADAEAIVDGPSPQRLQATRPRPWEHSFGEDPGHGGVRASMNAGRWPVQNSSDRSQRPGEHRDPRPRPHISVVSDSLRNDTHPDPASIQASEIPGSYQQRGHERTSIHRRAPKPSPSSRETTTSESSRSSSGVSRPSTRVADRQISLDSRDSRQQHRRSLAASSGSDSDRTSSGASASSGLPSKISTEMNAVDLSAMSRRVSNAGRGRGAREGSSSARVDPVRETAQHRASASRPASPVRSSRHPGPGQGDSVSELRESHVSTLSRQNGSYGSSTAQWVDDQRSVAPTAARRPATTHQPVHRQYERAVAGPSGYNQNLRGHPSRLTAAGARQYRNDPSLDELIARQIQAELDNADRETAEAAQNDEHMAREMQHEWDFDSATNPAAAKERLAFDEEVARRLQAEEDSANRATDKLRSEELAFNERVAREIELQLNVKANIEDDERLARQLEAEEKDRLAAANFLRSENLEDSERAALRLQAEADDEIAAANTARDAEIAENERVARLLQAEDEKNQAATDESRRDGLAKDEELARRLEAEEKANNIGDDERVARNLQAEEQDVVASLDVQREEELALNERVARQLQAEEDNVGASSNLQRDEELALNERVARQLQAQEHSLLASGGAQREEDLAFNERVAREMQRQYDSEASDIKHGNDIEEDECAARRIEAEWNGDSAVASEIPDSFAADHGRDASGDIPRWIETSSLPAAAGDHGPSTPARSYTATNTEDLYGVTPPRSPVLRPDVQSGAFPPLNEQSISAPPTSDQPPDVPGGTGLQYDVVRLRGDGHPSGPVEWIIHHWGRPSITFRYRMIWQIQLDLDIVHKARDDVTFDATVQVTLEIIDDMPDYEEAEVALGR